MASDPRFEFGRREFLRFAGGVFVVGTIATSPFAAFGQSAGAASLKIGTIGAGREGGALGTLFAKQGHAVMFSSRHPEALKDLVAAAGPTAQAGTVEQAVAFADVVVIAVPYSAMEQVGKDYGKALATKQLILDISNPNASRDGEIVKWVEEQGGAGLATAKLLPGAPIVRAFNAIGSGRLAPDANRAGDMVAVPIAGDDTKAIALASSLIKEVGFEPVLVGGLAMGKYLVPGTPLAGEHTAAEVRQIAATLK
jgi:predicted dinucleotide-binding enzyme